MPYVIRSRQNGKYLAYTNLQTGDWTYNLLEAYVYHTLSQGAGNVDPKTEELVEVHFTPVRVVSNDEIRDALPLPKFSIMVSE